MIKTLQIAFVLFLSLMFGAVRSQIIFDIPDATGTYITGINAATDICGYATFEGGITRGFLKTATDTIYLMYGATANTWAGGINDNGKIVGRYNYTGATNDYHVFIYDIQSGAYEVIPAFDDYGYDFIMPNDINNTGWISGDLKDGIQRRIFTWNETDGVVTNFVLFNGDVYPTYGGHDVDDNGRISAYYLAGIQHIGLWFQNGFGFSDTLNIPDPENGNIYKTQLTGGNQGYNLIHFFGSKQSWLFNKTTNQAVEKLSIPGALQVNAMDINEEGYIAGHYLDENYIAHGFFQAKAEIDFLPSEDTWNFVNTAGWCWVAEDYEDISYAHDPYKTEVYGLSENFPRRSEDGEQFPAITSGSWIEFVKACTEGECYQSDPAVGYSEINPNAFHFWEDRTTTVFGGICFGMASAALLAYDDLDLLHDVFPTTSIIDEFNMPPSFTMEQYGTDIIPPCRIAHMKQYSALQYPTNVAGYPRGAMEIIPEVYSALRDPGTSSKQLGVRLLGQDIHGNHVLVPYRFERDPEHINLYRIYVYDPNELLIDEKYIELKLDDTMAFSRYDFGGTLTQWTMKGLRISQTKKVFEEPFHLYQPGGPAGFRDQAYVLILGNHPDVHIESVDGGSIDVVGNAFTETTLDAEAIFPESGLNSKANEFLLSASEFNASITSLGNGFKASSQGSQGMVTYIRQSALPGETDHVMNVADVFSYINDEPVTRNVSAYILCNDGTSTYQYFCDNIEVVSGQSISLQIIDPTHVMITSNAAATNYDVRIRVFSQETGFWETLSPGIPIGSDVTQILIPDLVNDMFNGIIIESDNDGDGNFEESDSAANVGLPNMILSASELNIAPVSGSGEFNISNVGSGNLNWTFVEIPSWINISEGASGINHGHIAFTAEDNTGLTRQGWLIAEAADPGNDQDSVLVTQLGTNGVNDLDLSALMSLQPNPASGQVRVVKSSLLSGVALPYEIHDSCGRLVLKASMMNTEETIDIENWEPGVYTIRFISESKTHVKKLVVY